jgi:hypothetical protein
VAYHLTVNDTELIQSHAYGTTGFMH